MTTDTRAALEAREYIVFETERSLDGYARSYALGDRESMQIEHSALVERLVDLLAHSAPEERGEILYYDDGRSLSCGCRVWPGSWTPCEQHRPASAQEPEPNPLTGPPHPDDATERGFRCRPAPAPPVAQEDPTGHAPECEWSVERETWICHPSCDLHPAYRGVAEGAEPSLDDELHDLHDRLREEGRDADADLIDRAGWALDSADLERADYPVPQSLPREERRACPVCGGRGNVPAGFYSHYPYTSASTATTEMCRTCNGTTVYPPARPVAGSEEQEYTLGAQRYVVSPEAQAALHLALENCRSLAEGMARRRGGDSEWDHVLRFCEVLGPTSVLRAALRDEEVQDA